MKAEGMLAGCGKVFRFTLRQLIKSKSSRILLILTLVVSLAADPLLSLLKPSLLPEDGSTGIRTLYIRGLENTSDLSAEELKKALSEEGDSDPLQIKLIPADTAPDNWDGAVLLTVNEAPESLDLLVDWEDKDLSSSEVYGLSDTVYRALQRQRLEQAGVTGNAAELLLNGAVTSSADLDSFLAMDRADPENDPAEEGEEDEYSETAYNVQFGYSILLMMISLYAVSYIIRAVVEEKASKLVDLLMVSVKPLDLLLGKVLAVLVFVLLFMGLLMGGLALSGFITRSIFGSSSVNGLLQSLLGTRLSAPALLVVLVTSALGYLAFGLMAGLSGAGCSNTEETSGAMSTVTLLIMAGYMVSAVGVGVSQRPGFARACSVVPIISPFVAPLQFIYGNIGFGLVALSWLLQLLTILLLLRTAARVYRSLIIYNGKRLSFMKILRLPREKEASV